MKKCHPGSRHHAMHMNTFPTHGPVPPINQHSASTDYTLPLRNQAGFWGILGRIGCEPPSPLIPYHSQTEVIIKDLSHNGDLRDSIYSPAQQACSGDRRRSTEHERPSWIAVLLLFPYVSKSEGRGKADSADRVLTVCSAGVTLVSPVAPQDSQLSAVTVVEQQGLDAALRIVEANNTSPVPHMATHICGQNNVAL
ncbi:hypothetical protein FQA47_006600 [Oryzias melastigma]|uniref:Uncharacterized protein n=1 Tax=Oryzias melastigma TaxID=30732 RepID=A0A834F5U1_ORYME|nr:hypothetical protein FQA47_006600 [Oryzias melastigma]